MSANKNKVTRSSSKLLSKSDLRGIKTCADKIKDAPIPSKSPVTGSKFDLPAMRAAFLKGKILRAHTILKCAFLHQPPDDLIRTPTGEMETAVDENGVSIPLDPLQLEVDNMEIIPAIIHTITKRLQPIVNINLSFYEDEESKRLWNPNVADIRISFDPDGGSWSLLGKDMLDTKTRKEKNKATMNLGWFDVPTTLHEFCHALAMVHEHQNPIGKPINWNVDRVRQWAEESQGWDAKTTDTNIIKKYGKDQINGSEYDGKSIMLYFFPGTLVNNDNGDCCGSGTQQNLQFSPYDVLFLNKIYPLKGQSLTPEQFTVKFFNDNFNQQVDIETLKTQVQKNNEREGELTDNKDASDAEEDAQVQKKKKKKNKETFDEMTEENVVNNAIQPHYEKPKNDDESQSDKPHLDKEDYVKVRPKRRRRCTYKDDDDEDGDKGNFYSSNLFIMLLVFISILIGYFLIINCMSSSEPSSATSSTTSVPVPEPAAASAPIDTTK